MRLLLALVLLGFRVSVLLFFGWSVAWAGCTCDGGTTYYFDRDSAQDACSATVGGASCGYSCGSFHQSVSGPQICFVDYDGSCPVGEEQDPETGECIEEEPPPECDEGEILVTEYWVNPGGYSCVDQQPDPFACDDNEVEDVAFFENGGWYCNGGDGNCPEEWTLGTAYNAVGNTINTCSAPGEDPEVPDPPDHEPDDLPPNEPSEPPDQDGDGTPDHQDDDIDGDGIPNDEDPSPGGSGQGGGTATASGECSTPPVCEGKPEECAILRQQWYSMCYVENYEAAEEGFYVPDSGQSFNERLTGSMEDFKNSVESSEVVSGVSSFFDVSTGGSCPVYSVTAGPFDITLDQWCSSVMPWSLISGVLIVVASMVGIRIALG